MTENKVAATPVKTEAGSSEPTGQSSSKKSYNQRRNARRNQAKKNNTGGYVNTGPARSKFIGRTAAIKDHIFTMGTGSGALFSKSKKELLLHFSGKNEHIVTSIENRSPLELVPPTRGTSNRES